jgi:hypothetical protein
VFWFDPHQKRFMSGITATSTLGAVVMQGVVGWIRKLQVRHPIQTSKLASQDPSLEDRAAIPATVYMGRYQGAVVDSHFSSLSNGQFHVDVAPNRKKDGYRRNKKQHRHPSRPGQWQTVGEEIDHLVRWRRSAQGSWPNWLRQTTSSRTLLTNWDQGTKTSGASPRSWADRVHPLCRHAVLWLAGAGYQPLAGQVVAGVLDARVATAADAVWVHRQTGHLLVVELKKYETRTAADQIRHQLQLAVTTCCVYNTYRERCRGASIRGLVLCVGSHGVQVQWLALWALAWAQERLGEASSSRPSVSTV